MSFRFLNVALLLFLVLSLFLTGLLLHTQPISAPVEHLPEPLMYESMQHVKAFRFNEEGEKIQSLHMQGWTQKKNDPIIYMERPFLQVKNLEGEVWIISANQGKGFQKDKNGPFDKIELFEKVVLKQNKTDPSALTLNTEHLNYWPDTESFDNQERVTLSNGTMQTTALGFHARIKDQSITFSTEVKTTYEKPLS